jgi:ribosome-associated protein
MTDPGPTEPRPANDETAPPPPAPESTAELAHFIAELLRERKGEEISILGMEEVLPVADYFVIGTGRNARHVDSMVEYVEKRLKELRIPILNRSGKDTSWWVLLDLGAIVVHVFRREAREYYDLEMLWADAERVE